MSTDSTWPPTLGTPCSAGAVRVLLLGAGELGKEVLIALQRLGVETIAAMQMPRVIRLPTTRVSSTWRIGRRFAS
jgi:formate-dependent phosphoribosylglycinamide formyltransferase (GAR transformylase)